MSISKLGSTSGRSSQIAFDGKNPFSEKQHPLLQPTVLDNLFPYLTFPELKNSRHVCKAWSEVGIPLIGRRKLKPVHFSSINFEDFFALKQEFIKSPNKVKLFQGFRLEWDEMSGMIWSNFLACFKPSQLVISGENVPNPSTKLNNLLQPVLTTLTDLSLEIRKDSGSVSANLDTLAQLRPLTLKRLCFESDHGGDLTQRQVSAHFRALESLFQSQGPFLEELELTFNCLVLRPAPKNRFKVDEIQLPVFPRLHSLKLALEMTRYEEPDTLLDIFTPFDFCEKFPQLIQLNILDTLLFTMSDNTILLTKGSHLKKLNILEKSELIARDNNIDTFQTLYSSFPYLEELIFRYTPYLHLYLGGIEIPWVDTLRTLDVQGSPQNFKLEHLMKLENLHYNVDYEMDDFQGPWIPSLIETLLEHHRQLSHLKRLHLTYLEACFITPKILDQIQEGLPAELRAILTVDDNTDYEYLMRNNISI